MANLDGWDLALLAAAGYVAVMSLVRLMRHHQSAALEQIRDGLAREEKRRRTQRRAEDGSAAAKEKPPKRPNEAA